MMNWMPRGYRMQKGTMFVCFCMSQHIEEC